jgi:hypothetical protein
MTKQEQRQKPRDDSAHNESPVAGVPDASNFLFEFVREKPGLQGQAARDQVEPILKKDI